MKTHMVFETSGGRDRSVDPPEFDRLKYFYGQLLGARDFQVEQRFFLEKSKLQNRALHGHGVVCGLEVEHRAGDEVDEVAKDVCLPRLRLRPGLALDADGNELLARREIHISLAKALQGVDPKTLKPGDSLVLHLTLAHSTVDLEPTRPALPDQCVGSVGCYHGKTREIVRVVATTTPPTPDERCQTCWPPSQYAGETIAKVTLKNVSDPDAGVEIDNSVRRPLSRHVATRVERINWVHDASYDRAQAYELLKTGLLIKFTGPIQARNVGSGVLDVFIMTGSGSVRGDVKFLKGTPEPAFQEPDEDGLCRGIHFRREVDDEFCVSPGDRVLIVLRSPFLLDRCCQPLDGAHVGGWVGLLDGGPVPSGGAPPKPLEPCASLRGTYGAWTSGNGLPGVNFESWFSVTK